MKERIPRFAPGDRVDYAPLMPGRPTWTEGENGRIREVMGFCEGEQIRWRYQVAWPVKEGVRVLTQFAWHDHQDLVPHGGDAGWAGNWLVSIDQSLPHECGKMPQGGITIRKREDE